MAGRLTWAGKPTVDDFGQPITDEFIDGAVGSVRGPWAIMTPLSYRMFGIARLGTGYGQRYRLAEDGLFEKVEG